MDDLQHVYVDEHDPGDCQSVFDGFAEQYCGVKINERLISCVC